MNSSPDVDRIIVAANHQLVNCNFYREQVWKPALKIDQSLRSRASWQQALELIYDYDGRCWYPSGRGYHAQDVDVEFGHTGLRWLCEFFKADETGEAPLRYSRKWERLRMIHLYCTLVDLQEKDASVA